MPTSKNFPIGPSPRVSLPASLRLEVDALYRPYGFNPINSTNASVGDISGQQWRVRVLLLDALETARLAGNLHQEIRARLQLANNAFLAGDNVHAESYAREALATAGANQMESLAIRGLINLGNAYFRRRDFETAQKHYRDALALARRNNLNRLEAQGLLSLAALHDQEKRSDEAVAEAGAALAFWERGACVRRTKWEGTWQGGLGLLDTEGVQAAEVGRIDSGVLQTRLGAWSQAPCTKQWLQSEHVTSD